MPSSTIRNRRLEVSRKPHPRRSGCGLRKSWSRRFGSDGKPVNGQKQSSDTGDATVLIVTLPSLKPGKYKVVWKVVSVDTHLTSGDFIFQVAP